MKTRLYSRRYLKRILLLTTSLLMILCVIFIMILYINSYHSSKKSITEYEAQRTENLLFQTDYYWRMLESLSNNFANLNISYENLELSVNSQARTVFNAMLKSHMSANKYIQNIDVEIRNHSMSPSSILHERELGDFSFFTVYTEDATNWPYYFDLIADLSPAPNKVITTVSGYYLSKQLFTSDDEERLDYLLTDDGTILLTNRKSAFFQNINDLYPGIFSTQEKGAKEHIQTFEEYYYTFSEVDKYGFQVLSMVPKQTYTHQYTTLLLQTLLMSGLLLLIAVLISFFLTDRFYRPINNMVTLLRTYIPDDLQEYENEIAYIHENIAKYVTKGKNTEAQLSQSLSQLHNAQTAVLQYQINNHFLFNTLANIKAISVAELGADNEVENCIILLNTIIREGILQKTHIVPLSHELHLAKCYLELMQLRFPDVESIFTVDETLLDCSVFKFSLQPILENCFFHAFKGDIGRAKQIQISVFSKDSNLVICIKDNGLGLDDESLKQLLIADTESDQPHHVGVDNVHKRITTVFGEDYGITIESNPPGTTVTIRYPVTRKE